MITLKSNIDTLRDLFPEGCIYVSEYFGLLQANIRVGGSTQVSNDIGNEMLLVGGGKALPLPLNVSKGVQKIRGPHVRSHELGQSRSQWER
jgi:hypothetical protein